MLGFSIAAKLVGESRLEGIDVSAALGPSDALLSASASIAVYSGSDPTPSAVLGTVTVDAVYNLVNLQLLAAGVAGCIYQLVVTATLTTGTKTFTGFLTILPDAV